MPHKGKDNQQEFQQHRVTQAQCGSDNVIEPRAVFGGDDLAIEELGDEAPASVMNGNLCGDQERQYHK
jgi:hypothetical protein